MMGALAKTLQARRTTDPVIWILSVSGAAVNVPLLADENVPLGGPR